MCLQHLNRLWPEVSTVAVNQRRLNARQTLINVRNARTRCDPNGQAIGLESHLRLRYRPDRDVLFRSFDSGLLLETGSSFRRFLSFVAHQRLSPRIFLLRAGRGRPQRLGSVFGLGQVSLNRFLLVHETKSNKRPNSRSRQNKQERPQSGYDHALKQLERSVRLGVN